MEDKKILKDDELDKVVGGVADIYDTNSADKSNNNMSKPDMTKKDCKKESDPGDEKKSISKPDIPLM